MHNYAYKTFTVLSLSIGPLDALAMRCASAAPTDEDELERAGGGANEGLKADAGDVDQKPRSADPGGADARSPNPSTGEYAALPLFDLMPRRRAPS